MQTMQRFFKFLRRKILSVKWVGYSLQTPLNEIIAPISLIEIIKS